MLEGASAGGTSIPAPVQLFVYDTDVDDVREYVRRHRFGIKNLSVIVVGCIGVAWGIVRAQSPHTWLDLWMLYVGVFDIAGGWLGRNTMEILRPADLQFSAKGIEVTIGFTGRPPRCYRWPRIRRIDDTGEVFIIVPKFGTRMVVPKRSFPDDGREAWAFFTAHGVAGRTPPIPSPIAS